MSGHYETQKKSHAMVYRKASGAFSSYTEMDDGSYWKILEKGKGEPLQLGEKVVLVQKTCQHGLDQKETVPEAYSNPITIEKLNEGHYIYRLKTLHGNTLEVIGETYHIYVKVE